MGLQLATNGRRRRNGGTLFKLSDDIPDKQQTNRAISCQKSIRLSSGSSGGGVGSLPWNNHSHRPKKPVRGTTRMSTMLTVVVVAMAAIAIMAGGAGGVTNDGEKGIGANNNGGPMAAVNGTGVVDTFHRDHQKLDHRQSSAGDDHRNRRFLGDNNGAEDDDHGDDDDDRDNAIDENTTPKMDGESRHQKLGKASRRSRTPTQCTIKVQKVECVPGKCVRLKGVVSACQSLRGNFMEPFSEQCS